MWVSSIILIVVGSHCEQFGVIAGWLIVSVMWNDRALIIVNAVGVAILFEWFCWLFTRDIIVTWHERLNEVQIFRFKIYLKKRMIF